MKRLLIFAVVVLAGALSQESVRAFCGFYVSKADTKLFNRASQVVLVRHDDKTVITMANDFRGDPKEFAVVIPVPTFIERGQIHIAEKALIDHLDAYSSPRLVEYFDEDPCLYRAFAAEDAPAGALRMQKAETDGARSLGVTIEAQYTVGEYDILILSAEESNGLETWLDQNGYQMPPGASRVLGSYIRQNMRFFVAKVNLGEQSRLGFNYLRPLQVAYESPKFMLPIRLGTVNADGPQELFIYTLTRNGRVETTNYRTVQLPTGMDIPVFVKDEFGDFYRSMFTEQVRKHDMSTIFVEYAWDMAWCDPCAADPLSYDELMDLGVFWLDGLQARGAQAQEVFLTRLHVRYDGEHFPEDLVFQETADRSNFQGRYVLRHAWEGSDNCRVAREYRRQVAERHEQEAQTLASLTGWNVSEIRQKMNLHGDEPESGGSWWERLWNN
jgi:hypothetical protein